jgi:hypothetical protein
VKDLFLRSNTKTYNVDFLPLSILINTLLYQDFCFSNVYNRVSLIRFLEFPIFDRRTTISKSADLK